MKAVVFVVVFLICGFSSSAQLIKNYDLSKSLAEISGLELLNDTTLITLNDGGGKCRLYLLNLKGKIIRKVDVLNVKNKDWEDLSIDKKHIYIGDIGNNENKRVGLKIYKVAIKDVLNKSEVKAQTIKFNYGEQRSFPPASDSMYFDAEGMAFYNDSIWLFTKDRSNPSSGNARIYKIPTIPGDYTVYCSGYTFIGKNGWWRDGITAADQHDGCFYLLTYDRYIKKRFVNGKLVTEKTFKFNSMSQRESIVVLNKDSIFVADEKNPLVGDMKLYNIHPKK
ncbi:hypothetical protein OAU25_02785 [Crocinitomicaceae bacterium]|nr:hypothetical protein [Crocinitomicaceae bacterium]